MTDYRLLIRHSGGPEAIEREDIDPPAPAAHEVRVRQAAIGINFIDTYQRSGLYPVDLPSGLGSEAAGVVDAVGDGVQGLTVGDRVAYAGGPLGAYATVRNLPAEWLVRLPGGVTPEVAAAVLLKGQTVDMLAGACAHVTAGQTVLVHAASGGVGSLLVPWLRSIGATVIAHAGTPAKAERAAALGATHALSGPMDGLAAQVRELTDGRGVDVVMDGVGQASWDASLASVARRGLLVSYGNASGAVPPVPPLALARAGSLFLTRPTLFDYLDTQAARQASADRVFARVADGSLPVEIGRTFHLDEAAEAHRALEARATVGSTVLLT